MDTVNVTDASDGQMELVLESDEEEASLLEEMEQQEAVPSADIGLECKRESVFDDTQQRENNKFPEVNDSLRTYLNKDTLGIHGNSQCRQSVQQSILPKFHSGKPVMEEVPDNEQEDQLEGAQILQLDISENDLIAAKSAVALQLQMETVDLPSTSFPPHFLSLDGVSGGLSLAGLGISHPDMGPSGADIKGKRKRIQKTSKLSDVKGGGCNHFKRPVGEHALSSGTQQKQEDKVPVGYIHQQEKNTKEDMNNGIVKNTKDFPRGIPTTESSEPPEVVFSCQFCNVKYPLEEENIPGIIKHLNPPQRYNHVFRMPEQLSCYKENIKLNVLIAKNKSKAQVQLVSCVECLVCKQQLTCSIENSEHIILHMYWCKNKDSNDSKTVLCLFCNERINRSGIRKHLHNRSRRCKRVDALILQLMSSVCEDYAHKHKPICIVCDEREWPYKGHRYDMEPVCESCHLNITSGNTTKLAQRDVIVCAICGLHCANKYVTYWASEMESLFIGESCIKKLKNPKPKLSEEFASLKASKLKTFIETTLPSVTVQEGSENDPSIARLAPNIFSTCERKLSSSSNLIQSSQGYREKHKANNFTSKGKITPVARSFKILNSYTSLPLTNLVPSFAFVNSTEAAGEVKIEYASSLTDVASLNFKQLETQAFTESQASRVSFIPLAEQTNNGDECKIWNTLFKLQEKLPCIVDGKNKNCAQITCNSEGGKVGNALQIEAFGNGNSDSRMHTEPTSKSGRNNLSTLSSIQSSITESLVDELCLYRAASKVTTGSQQPKYVIKCLSASRSKPVKGRPNVVDRNHVIIKASSNMQVRDEAVKSPRLGTVIKTMRLVCKEDYNEKKKKKSNELAFD